MKKGYAAIAAAHRAGIDLEYRAPDLPAAVRAQLPEPVLADNPEWVELYWRAWGIAHDKLRAPPAGSGLAPYCDAAFSEHLFQWDACFMIYFLRYAPGLFHAYGTLGNFYRKQHADGFICREISSITGADFWAREHGSSINPPLFSDAEWAMYRISGDWRRIKEVFEPLCKYHQWLKENRRAADGIGYWTTALGSGMDNTPRAHAQGGEDVHQHYGYAWMCMTAQQAMSARRLGQIAAVIGEDDAAARYEDECRELAAYVRKTFWHRGLGCYSDLAPDGSVSGVMTPAMCWPLLLAGCPAEHAAQVAAKLSDEALFWRPHAVASLSADHERFNPQGGYWCGSVWPPMVHLAARAMHETGHHELAARIAANHLENVAAVYRETGTFWENYASDSAQPGEVSRPEFVGWTGCGPIALLLESAVGLAASAPDRRVAWRMSRVDDHGVRNLPLGEGRVDLLYSAEAHAIRFSADEAFDLTLIREGKEAHYPGLQGEGMLRL